MDAQTATIFSSAAIVIVAIMKYGFPGRNGSLGKMEKDVGVIKTKIESIDKSLSDYNKRLTTLEQFKMEGK